MCLGTPFQITAVSAGFVEGQDSQGQSESLNTALIDTPKVGDWVLGFLGSALSILSAEQADEMNEAHDALRKVRAGEVIHADDFSFSLPSEIDPQKLKTLTGQL